MSDLLPKQDRRKFLRQAAALVPISTLGACGRTETAATQTPAQASNAVAQVDPTRAKPRFFSEQEWAFVHAACGRLVPEDDEGPGAVSLGVPHFIDRQMEGEFGHAARWYMQGPFFEGPPELGYQSKLTPREVYRLGIAATDDYCKQHHDGKRFADLSPQVQDEVLKGLEGGHITFDQVSATSFFGFLLQNTHEGYLADPLHGGNKDMGSWKMIGFPGARADFLDWVGQYGKAYPLGPVDVDGQQG